MLRRMKLATVVCVFSFLMTACERQKISDITSDPGRYQGKEVSVAGKVTNVSVGVSVGGLGMGFYQIDDGTGKLYVVSEHHGAPVAGATVGVKGTIMPTFTFMGKNYATVLRESDRRAAHTD
jgi:major membrane immunogen (membrane-anchored lipoprotein)